MMLRDLHRALGALAIATAGCGGGDSPGGGNGNPPRDDGGVTGQTDGGGAGGRKDSGGMTGMRCGDVACGANQVCRDRSPNGNGGDLPREERCASANPLIDAMWMGLWTIAEVNGIPRDEEGFILTTDPFQPDCSGPAGAIFGDQLPAQEAGDACITMLGSNTFFVLDGMRVRLSFGGGHDIDGRVLEDGSRIETDSTTNGEVTNRAVYVKLFSCLNCPAQCGCSNACGCTMVAP